MRKILDWLNEHCKKYKEIIETANIIGTLILSIIALYVSQTALEVSQQQSAIMQQELQNEETRSKPVFHIECVGIKNKQLNNEDNDLFDTSVTCYEIVNVGGDIIWGKMVPITLIDVYYDNNYITSFSINKYADVQGQFDIEKKNFSFGVYNEMGKYEDIKQMYCNGYNMQQHPDSQYRSRC